MNEDEKALMASARLDDAWPLVELFSTIRREHPDDGNRAAQRCTWRGDGGRFGIARGEQAAADLDPRLLRFGRTDQSAGKVAIDLGELVAVDRDLRAVGPQLVTPAERPQHSEHRRDRHQREHKPRIHQAGPGEAAPFPSAF